MVFFFSACPKKQRADITSPILPSLIISNALSTGAINKRLWSTQTMRFTFSAVANNFMVSSSLKDIGFSTSTSFPDSKAKFLK